MGRAGERKDGDVPVGEVVSCDLEGVSRAVLWVELGVDDMRFC